MTLSNYYAPTRVTFGRGAEENIAMELKKEGARKVLVHYGSDRIEKNGFLDRILALLRDGGIGYTLLGGVVPNPRLSLVRKAVEKAGKENADFILAVGGGSVIDSAKAAAYALSYDGDVWDFYSGKAKPQSSFPVGCILTMAAAGSEMSDSSVITNDECGNLKRGCNSDSCRLRFALMNPELTYTLPPYQTACALVDIQMHTLERYFVHDYSLSLTDNLAVSLLRTVRESGLRALAKCDDYDARASLMWASSLSHNGLMALGASHRGDWASHQIEHELSGRFDIAHGAGLSIIWPSWARYTLSSKPERYASLGYALFSIEPSGDFIRDGERMIEAQEDFYRSINMPVRLSEAGITLTDDDIEYLSESCSFNRTRTVGDMMKLNKEDIAGIYRMAR